MNRLALRISLLIIFISLSGTLIAETLTYQRWRKFSNLANPKIKERSLLLFNDLNGNGKAEVVMRYKDLHNGQDAEFRIYSLKITGNKAETDSLLLKIKTSDDYCKRIQLRDVDGDGVKEILLMTVSRDLTKRQLYIVRVDKKFKIFTQLKPNKPFGSHIAEYRFTRKTAHNPAELKIITPLLSRKSIFKKITAIRKAKPHFWLKQFYYIKSDKLEQFDSSIIYTPFYVLDKFLRAVRKQKFFSAYRHFFSKIPYFKFKKMIQKRYHFLASKGIIGDFYLYNWYTEKYRKLRKYGWLTFGFHCQKGSAKYRIMYQAFLKKVFDEWKIIKIRRIRFIKG